MELGSGNELNSEVGMRKVEVGKGSMEHSA